jgi:hypothetical protein
MCQLVHSRRLERSNLWVIAAMTEVLRLPATLDDPAPPKIVLEVIASELLRSGERDPVRLVKAALPWLTRE